MKTGDIVGYGIACAAFTIIAGTNIRTYVTGEADETLVAVATTAAFMSVGVSTGIASAKMIDKLVGEKK